MTTAPSLARPTALITGASAGIGAELAHCYAAAGHDLVLVARSVSALQTLAKDLKERHGIAASVHAHDLAAPGAVQALADALEDEGRNVDVLVNCAGVMVQGAFTGITPDRHQSIIDLNISALTALLSAFVPGMVERGSGRVLNVASVAAFQPVPSLASYAASKAYVLSLSEGLSEELKGTGVTVTALCPGITATNMLQQAAQSNDKLRKIPSFLIGDVAAVAREGFEACQRGDAIVVPGAVNRSAMLASRATPKWLVRLVGGALGRRAL